MVGLQFTIAAQQLIASLLDKYRQMLNKVESWIIHNQLWG